MIRLSGAEARTLRLRAGRLAPRARDVAVATLLADVCGVQAQERGAAALAIRARTRAITAADVDAAVAAGDVVRTWCARGTLHLLASDDVRPFLAAFGDRFATRGPEPRRLAEAGLDAAATERAVATVGEVLAAHGPLDRDALGDRLRAVGVDVPRAPELGFLIRRAALRGVCCETTPGTYARLDDRVPPDPDADGDPDAALVAVAGRYLRAFGPATRADFAAWSGLPAGDVRTAWDGVVDDAVEVGVDGATAWVDAAVAVDRVGALDGPVVRLLPGYDAYLLGYDRANRAVPDGFESTVWPGAGVVRPTLLVDGIVAGTWRLDRSRARPRLAVAPFDPLPAPVDRGLRAEAADVGRFLGVDPPAVDVD